VVGSVVLGRGLVGVLVEGLWRDGGVNGSGRGVGFTSSRAAPTRNFEYGPVLMLS
jgi:hypothetical protein